MVEYTIKFTAICIGLGIVGLFILSSIANYKLTEPVQKYCTENNYSRYSYDSKIGINYCYSVSNDGIVEKHYTVVENDTTWFKIFLLYSAVVIVMTGYLTIKTK